MSEPKWIVNRLSWKSNFGDNEVTPISETIVYRGKSFEEVKKEAARLNNAAEKSNKTAAPGKVYSYIGTCE